MTDKQYDDAILDSNAIDPTDVDGNPIPVTIPIMLAPGVKVVYTTRLGGTSEGDYAHCNLGGKSGDDPNHVLANRVALSNAIDAKLSLVSQVHSGVAVDVDELFVMNRPFVSTCLAARAKPLSRWAKPRMSRQWLKRTAR